MVLAAVAWFAASQRPSTPETSDVYVWQRAWHPALRDALQQARDLTHAWHVLGAEATPRGALRPVAVDLAWLASTGRPVVLVVRIDGQLAGLDGPALVRDIVALRQRWRAGGLVVSGVEIDHDCGTARLSAYALWLADLRRALGAATSVSITALPAWLGSPALEQVLAQADESVLQVHAVRQPREGLFDPALAWQWTTAWSRRDGRPFRVALPTYGSRVGFDAAGALSDIESESPTLRNADERRELSVSPAAVAAFVARVRADPPAHWLGWAWFRLPTSEDSRAWRMTTWRAVVEGRPLRTSASVDWRPAGNAATYDVLLVNRGDTDADVPARVALPSGCAQADGANGYHLAASPGPRALNADAAALLPPHASRVIGWMHCDRLLSS
ncbi:MAG: DUF3142 domain-containing protein [Burkholderiaceae bacterium]